MDEFDCYCAICGASITGGEIGSKEPDALAYRHRLVERRRRARELGEEEASSEEDEGDDNEDDGHVESWWKDEEQRTYDPELVNENSIAWLFQVRCLGFNCLSAGNSRAFISGPGSYEDAGSLEVELGDDPNQPQSPTMFNCYEAIEQGIEAVFPLHDCCLELLTECLTGAKDVSGLDKDVLYEAMFRLSGGYATSLSLDYGAISGQDQCWESISGEEFSVSHPLQPNDFIHALSTAIVSGLFTTPSGSTLPRHNHMVQDPFSRLSPELLYSVLDYLPGKSLLALITASCPAFLVTNSNDFWKQYLYRIPWNWEFRDMLDETGIVSVDYKRLYLWLEAKTTPVSGVDVLFMSIANRRRIWGVCEQIKGHCLKAAYYEPQNEPDKTIVDQSECSHMPFVSVPPPEQPSIVETKLWVHSRKEIDGFLLVFEAFWDPAGALVGLGVAVGASQRIFGIDDSHNMTVKKTAGRIERNNWVESLVLYSNEAHNSDDAELQVAIGLKVNLTSGKCLSMGVTGVILNQRSLVVSEGGLVVGISGQIREDGVITRLGLLECREPNSTATSSRSYTSSPLQGRLLHSGTRHDLPLYTSLDKSSHKQSSSLVLLPLTSADGHDDPLLRDLSAHATLLWGSGAGVLGKLERIWLRVAKDDGVSGAGNLLLGVGVQYILRFWEPERYIGLRSPGCMGKFHEWPVDEMVQFDVDGPGGERITEVAIAWTTELRVFKLTTNKGREVSVGHGEDLEWTVQRAPEGQALAGLVMAFGIRGKGPVTAVMVLAASE
ncbi:hypothetical protein EDB80DRAFT_783222 [Ilyonectria destructans]|nr:hypothetical protein EDB80DRAFT_783222 [Ilyonectria destructans]